MLFEKINHIDFYQFGCGGTGSYLVPPLSKFIYNIENRFGNNIIIYYYIIDDDIVEERNIIRQNFFEYDIGRNKVDVKIRENHQLVKNLYGIKQRIDTKKKIESLLDINIFKIVIGCCDNNKTRRAIFSYMKKNKDNKILYFDSGNNLNNGQIVSTVFSEDVKNMFLNGENHKNVKFFKMFPAKVENESNESCAFFGDQSQCINMFAANLLFMNIQRVIIERLLPPNLITFNSTGYCTYEI